MLKTETRHGNSNIYEKKPTEITVANTDDNDSKHGRVVTCHSDDVFFIPSSQLLPLEPHVPAGRRPSSSADLEDDQRYY